jgi:Fe-S-cluster containining protein
VTDDEALPAGRFSTWLHGMQLAIAGEAGSDVPCGGCTACCTSSQFVHIGPDEKDTLAQIPAGLLFPAPRMPRGHVLLGYDDNGHCPMLVEGKCSIYEHRPRTCRTYDCRVFAAAGVEVEEDKPAIGSRVRRWRFEFSDEIDAVLHEAVVAAANFVRQRADQLPEEVVPVNATQRAVLAVRLHAAFVGVDDPEPEAIRVVLES